MENIDVASALAKTAAADGAVFISLPECVALLEPDINALSKKLFKEAEHPALSILCISGRTLGLVACRLSGSLF